jgi:hypothetical protein
LKCNNNRQKKDEIKTHLAQKRNDGDTRVTTNDGDLGGGGVGTLDFGDESGGTDDIQSGDTEQALGVVDTVLAESLSNDGDSRVDRVGDDQDVGLGGVPIQEQSSLSLTLPFIACNPWNKRKNAKIGIEMNLLGNSLGNTLNDVGVGVEQVITSHTGLSGDTSRDNNDIGTNQGLTDVLGTLDTGDLGNSVDVGQVSSDTGGVDNVEEGEGRNSRVELQEEGEGLTDTTGGTDDGDLLAELLL